MCSLPPVCSKEQARSQGDKTQGARNGSLLEGCGRLSALLVLQSIRAEGGQEEWCAPPAAREGKFCLSEPFPLLTVGFPRDAFKGYDGKGAHRLCLVHLMLPRIPQRGEDGIRGLSGHYLQAEPGSCCVVAHGWTSLTLGVSELCVLSGTASIVCK